MAIRIPPLPPEAFPESARVAIERFNRGVRDLTGLEGSLDRSTSSRRSDSTIARRQDERVHVTRITPDLSALVESDSGSIPVVNDLGTVPSKVVLRMLKNSGSSAFPDGLYISAPHSSGWGWSPIMFLV